MDYEADLLRRPANREDVRAIFDRLDAIRAEQRQAAETLREVSFDARLSSAFAKIAAFLAAFLALATIMGWFF